MQPSGYKPESYGKMALPMTTETKSTESLARGEFVREFRRLHRVELAELAKRADLSVPMVSQFERGNRNLSGSAWKRVLTAINAIVNENAEALGAQFQKLSSEWMDLAFFPMLTATADSLPEHLRDKPGQTWTPEDIAEALSKPSRLAIVERERKEVLAALEVWETVQKLVPEADAEIQAEQDSVLLADPAECLRQLKQVRAYCAELRAAIEVANTKLANLEAAGYVIVPKTIVAERDELREQNAKLLADLRVLRGEG